MEIALALRIASAVNLAWDNKGTIFKMVLLLLSVSVIVMAGGLFSLLPVADTDQINDYKSNAELIGANWTHLIAYDMILNGNDFTDADPNRSAINFIVAHVVEYKYETTTEKVILNGKTEFITTKEKVQKKAYDLVGSEVFKLTGTSNDIDDIVDRLNVINNEDLRDVSISSLDLIDLYDKFTPEQRNQADLILEQNLITSYYGDIYVMPGENIAPVSSGFFMNPVPSLNKVSRPFGRQIHPIYNVVKMHTGIDLVKNGGGSLGQPIYAAADGYITNIVHSNLTKGYGNRVEIKHVDANGRKWATLYAHMDSISPNLYSGMKVSKGTFIGRVGTSGGSTGPHLHFEIKFEDNYVDPAKYIDVSNFYKGY